ncbi:MAG: hypothetical protein SGJ20_04965, partial [Planctomycetota bacterium]|nr:hypothetical protein [Planctomycetota bacterium]
LESERERGAFHPTQQHMVLISSISRAVFDLVGEAKRKKSVANRINLAIKFLAGAGVIQRARSVVSDSPKDVDSSTAIDIDRRKRVSKQLKEKLEAAPWTRELPAPEKEVLSLLKRCQADCFFFVNDEIMLRRCVLEPNLALFQDLASRRRDFLQQPVDIEQARDNHLVEVTIDSLKKRFENGLWRYDSLGWPIVDEA